MRTRRKQSVKEICCCDWEEVWLWYLFATFIIYESNIYLLYVGHINLKVCVTGTTTHTHVHTCVQLWTALPLASNTASWRPGREMSAMVGCNVANRQWKTFRWAAQKKGSFTNTTCSTQLRGSSALLWRTTSLSLCVCFFNEVIVFVLVFYFCIFLSEMECWVVILCLQYLVTMIHFSSHPHKQVELAVKRRKQGRQIKSI